MKYLPLLLLIVFAGCAQTMTVVLPEGEYIYKNCPHTNVWVGKESYPKACKDRLPKI